MTIRREAQPCLQNYELIKDIDLKKDFKQFEDLELSPKKRRNWPLQLDHIRFANFSIPLLGLDTKESALLNKQFIDSGIIHPEYEKTHSRNTKFIALFYPEHLAASFCLIWVAVNGSEVNNLEKLVLLTKEKIGELSFADKIHNPYKKFSKDKLKLPEDETNAESSHEPVNKEDSKYQLFRVTPDWAITDNGLMYLETIQKKDITKFRNELPVIDSMVTLIETDTLREMEVKNNNFRERKNGVVETPDPEDYQKEEVKFGKFPLDDNLVRAIMYISSFPLKRQHLFEHDIEDLTYRQLRKRTDYFLLCWDRYAQFSNMKDFLTTLVEKVKKMHNK